MNDQDHAAIQAKAYSLWEAAGCPDGRDLDFWLEAEPNAPQGMEVIV